MKICSALILMLLLSACGSEKPTKATAECIATDQVNWTTLLNKNCSQLSQYGLFLDPSNPLANTRTPGLPYALNSTLFTDHARKYRYVFIPPNQQADYIENDSFYFPVGTVLVKVFTMPANTSLPEERILEVRLLIHRTSGWIALPYVWDETVQDAILDINGQNFELSVTHNNVAHTSYYSVPTYAACSTCHSNGQDTVPIGLKARHLNKAVLYQGESINQLTLWTNLGLLNNLPHDLSIIDTAPDWQNQSANLQDRAKAYLDINCAHCHSDGGAAALSGLRLEYWRKTIDYHHGVCNSAHGWRGGGFDIWPGDASESAIPKRMAHTTAADQMPPIGRSLTDQGAVDIIKQWINAMPYDTCAE